MGGVGADDNAINPLNYTAHYTFFFKEYIRVNVNGVHCEMRSMKTKFRVTKAIVM